MLNVSAVDPLVNLPQQSLLFFISPPVAFSFSFVFVFGTEEDQLMRGDLNQKGKNDSKYSPLSRRCSTSLLPSTPNDVPMQQLSSCGPSKETEAANFPRRPRTSKADQPIAAYKTPTPCPTTFLSHRRMRWRQHDSMLLRSTLDNERVVIYLYRTLANLPN